jgi:hypothetical protein
MIHAKFAQILRPTPCFKEEICILNKEKLYLYALEQVKPLLQILGTLDKPSVEKEIELRINNQNILTMNDKSLSNLGI